MVDFKKLALKSAERRLMLSMYPPICDKCCSKQVQILDWFRKPAQWRCRECKHLFEYEPEMENKMHLMIDLETLSSEPNAVVLEFGWALFALEESFVHSSGVLYPDVEEQLLFGRRISWSTINWWMKQSEEARQKVFAKRDRWSFAAFQQNIYMLCDWDNIEGVWSHGATFDLVILQNWFRSYGLELPWAFRKTRDTRTLLMAQPTEFVKAETKHSAQDDAIAQARTIQNAWQLLRAPGHNYE